MQGCNDGYTPPREITNWVKWVMYTHEPIWNKRLRCDTTRLNNLLVVYYLMVSNNLKLGDWIRLLHKCLNKYLKLLFMVLSYYPISNAITSMGYLKYNKSMAIVITLKILSCIYKYAAIISTPKWASV